MNILFITEDHTKENYGVTTVVSQLADEIADSNNGMNVIIAAIGGDSVSQHKSVKIELIRSAKVGAFWGWSPDLMHRLNDIITNHHINLIHVNGIWMAMQLFALTIARKRNIPCIVSANGMLEPWLWNKQSLFNKYKKKIYFNFIFQHIITEHTIFHAITPIEKDNLHKLLPKQKIVMIPNAIGLEKEHAYDNTGEKIVPEKIFSFLGRMHPVKGVSLLINAFYQANLGSEWRLLLAGPESVPQYVEKIKANVLNLGLSNRVEFVGPVFGTDKQELIRKSWALVIPSYSEVMGMVNLEAAACRVPSITTYETGLWDWEEGGGILIHPNVNELTTSLLRASRWSMAERLDYGNKSYQLVVNKYSCDTVVPRWEALYSSLISDHDIHSN
jgi:glycosyltransferase involved in cell wall biosynthesis